MTRQTNMLGNLYRLHGRFNIQIKSFTLEFNADFLMMDETFRRDQSARNQNSLQLTRSASRIFWFRIITNRVYISPSNN